MKKSIRILISVIILLLGFIAADCTYGFAFGGEFNWIAGIITFVFGIVLTTLSVILIFDKNERKEIKAKDTFAIIIIAFMIFCIFGYKPLNRISGTNDYTEQKVKVTELYGAGKGDWLFLDPQFYVTVKDKKGNEFVVGDYNIVIDYEEGDTITLREYTGGFDLKYYSIVYQ